MKKIIRITFINIFLLFLLIFAAEVLIWACENARIKIFNEKNTTGKIIPFHPKPKNYYLSLDYFPQPKSNWGRYPDGLEYSKKPVVLFGCSFAYGFFLKDTETMSYKISRLTKRPVYNRAASGWSIQHMLYQVRQSKFYEKVPEPEYVIFLLINDHFRRLYVPTFLSTQMLSEIYNLRYKCENDRLVLKDRPNKIKDFFKQSYIIQKLEHAYINNFVVAPRNYENYSRFALKHFTESRAAMQKHWKNTKYIIIFYQHFYNDYKFKELLEREGFEVLSLQDLSDIDIYSDEYMQKNYHPTAKAWDVFAPIIVEKAGLN